MECYKCGKEIKTVESITLFAPKNYIKDKEYKGYMNLCNDCSKKFRKEFKKNEDKVR